MYGLNDLKKTRILIAEDDNSIRNGISKTLRVFCKQVLEAKDGIEALSIYEDERPDLILCDVKMPKMSGLDFIKRVRLVDYNTPVIVLSSHSDSQTLLEAVNLDISGYIVKPCKFEELVLVCCKAVVKSMQQKSSNKIVTFGNDRFFSFDTSEFFIDGKAVDLGDKERKLLDYLIVNKNKTASKEEIISHIWPLEEITDSAIKNLISRLRKKIGEEYIINVKNAGWRLHIDD